ncbi:hypothetical protein [Pseudoduganella violaceinigra]|uniref:hypothetical protein n=1 Tax=Pseudoduganella violaceinigra TaxID=246602 RepID=UPI0004840FE1|nr:hypothetical protein [Pseudoduganella violaceinigra]
MTTAVKQPAAELPTRGGREEVHTSPFQPAIDFFRLDHRGRLPIHQNVADAEPAPINSSEF